VIHQFSDARKIPKNFDFIIIDIAQGYSERILNFIIELKHHRIMPIHQAYVCFSASSVPEASFLNISKVATLLAPT
jgi:hypothetical protein